METRKGLLTKLAMYTGVAVTLTVIGKKHIAAHKEDRYVQESNTTVGNEDFEFIDKSRRPGFPTNNPNLTYEGNTRESRYVGSGLAYATRTKGDRLGIWNIIWLKRGDNDN